MRWTRYHKSVARAMMAGSLLMLVSGLSYRVWAVRLCMPLHGVPVYPALFAQFPRQIGDWTAEEMPLDREIVRRTGTDAHLSRRYSRRNGLESISLYVACGTNREEVMGHYPEVCYGGTGRLLKKREYREVPRNDGTRVPCTIFQFLRGGLEAEQAVVLHYAFADGRYYEAVSRLWSKAWRRFAGMRYVAQVQIVATEALGQEAGVHLVSSFAADSAAAIARLFADIDKSQRAASSGEVDKAEKPR